MRYKLNSFSGQLKPKKPKETVYFAFGWKGLLVAKSGDRPMIVDHLNNTPPLLYNFPCVGKTRW